MSSESRCQEIQKSVEYFRHCLCQLHKYQTHHVVDPRCDLGSLHNTVELALDLIVLSQVSANQT